MNSDANFTSVGVPETPWFLTSVALAFVPGVYLVLLLSGVFFVAVGFLVLVLLYQVVTSEVHGITGKAVVFLGAVGIGILIGVFAVFKGLWRSIWRRPDFQPALKLDLGREPKLLAFLQNLCEKVGTGLPTAVLLHAEPTFFVQQGKVLAFNGEVKGRVLAIGAPLLNVLSINEFRAILSHEFAHFTGRDTLYSSMVLPVYDGSLTAVREMAGAIANSEQEGGTAQLLSLPLFLPKVALEGYLKAFHQINMKISRLREKRADTLATLTCGSQAFSGALKKTASLGTVYMSIAPPAILDALKEKKAFINFYDSFRQKLPELSGFVNECEQTMLAEPEAPFASHPVLSTRLNYLPNVPDKFADFAPGSGLFQSLEEYERELTNGYTHMLGTMAGLIVPSGTAQ